MKYFFGKIKTHFRKILQAAVVFGAAFLVLLYFLGYYDFSFLDRYKLILDDADNGTEKVVFAVGNNGMPVLK